MQRATQPPGDRVSGDNGRRAEVAEQQFQQIREALRGLQFGAVHVIVQDGVVVQIDRIEKRRLKHCR